MIDNIKSMSNTQLVKVFSFCSYAVKNYLRKDNGNVEVNLEALEARTNKLADEIERRAELEGLEGFQFCTRITLGLSKEEYLKEAKKI